MKKLKDLELEAIDNMVAYLLKMRRAVENTKGVKDLGIRKKQTHWVSGEPASSYKPGMEDCGK